MKDAKRALYKPNLALEYRHDHPDDERKTTRWSLEELLSNSQSQTQKNAWKNCLSAKGRHQGFFHFIMSLELR